MGQKVHPIGFRVGITKKHQSLWFARFTKYKYSQSLLEDQMLRKTLSETLNNLFGNQASLNGTNRSKFKQRMPTITSITIERNLIPYGIIIGIHARNCFLFRKKLIQLPFNSTFQSKITRVSERLHKVRYLVANFKIKYKKKEAKKVNIKESRFEKRKKILAIYHQKILKHFVITKKGNQIIQNLILKKNINKIIFKNKKSIFRNKKSIFRKKKSVFKKNINFKNKKSVFKKNINFKNKNYISKKDRLISLKREFFTPSPKGEKLLKIVLGKKLYLSKNKKSNNILKTKSISSRQTNKNFKNSSKNIHNLRKSISKRMFKNPSKTNNNLSKKIVKFNRFKNCPILRVRRVFKKFKEEIKITFFKKKNQIIKTKKNFALRMKKKFIKIFLNKMHSKFTTTLKENYQQWSNQMVKNPNLSPFNFLKKWHLTKSPIFFIFLKTLKSLNKTKQLTLKQEDLIHVLLELNKIKKFLVPLKRFLIILKNKLRLKFKLLKKEFITLGSIPKVQSFAFYQVLYYFNNLQKLINQFKKITKRQNIISKFDKDNNINQYIDNISVPFFKNKKQSKNSVKGGSFIKSKKQSNKQKTSSASANNKTLATDSLSLNNQLLFEQLTKKQPKLNSINQIFAYFKKIQLKNTNINNKVIKKKVIKNKDIKKKTIKKKAIKGSKKYIKYASKETKSLIKKNLIKKQKLNIKIHGRRMKFMTYIKDIIKKHRTKNLYFYLPIIAEAQRKIRENNHFLRIKANKFFGPEVQSLIKENISAKKELETNETSSDKITKIKKKLTPCVNKILQKNYLLKIQRKETFYLLKLRSILEEQIRLRETLQFKSKVKIKFFSVQIHPFLSKASTISQSIVDALEKRKPFRQVIKNAQKVLLKDKNRVKGVKIQVAGRLNGAEIARTEWVRGGRVPLQTLSSNIDYSYRTASTIYGIIGVKVWIFKGYAKFLN
jgi:ribosomal protein S3